MSLSESVMSEADKRKSTSDFPLSETDFTVSEPFLPEKWPPKMARRNVSGMELSAQRAPSR